NLPEIKIYTLYLEQENASFEQNQTTNDTLESSLSTELLVTPPLP
ncbi:12414_t:CDS:2, partial [Entrophospora sp. SA101]